MKRRTAIKAIFSLPAFTLAPFAVTAQESYPQRPVQIVVGVPPGGSIDVIARTVGEKLTQSLGQPFVVSNRPGASGIIGTDFVARAQPDGYILTMAPAAFIASNASTFAKLPYDPEKDLAPIILAVNQPMVLVVNTSSPYETLAQLIAYARTHPGKLDYASGGEGSPHHFAGMMFSRAIGTSMLHIPYKGGGPAMSDLLGGHVDMIFAPAPEVLPQLQAKKLRALAVLGAERSAIMPDIPTMKEMELPEVALTAWIGLMAPAGTPADIVSKLNTSVEKSLSGELKNTLQSLGFEVIGGSPEDFHRVIKSDIAMYANLMKESGMKPQ